MKSLITLNARRELLEVFAYVKDRKHVVLLMRVFTQ